MINIITARLKDAFKGFPGLSRPSRFPNPDPLTRTDFIYLGILISAFTLLAFFRLGNTFAPQSYYTTDTQNRDIVLDFGDYVDLSSFSVFLGNLNTRHFSVSAFNEVSGAWEIINGEAVAESVFAWNQIDLNYRLRYLGIVVTDDES